MNNYQENLARLSKHPQLLKQLGRGIERESLRIDKNARISSKKHPESLGKALTNKVITTDFAESLIELITPVCTSVEELLGRLNDIHKFVYENIDDEVLWPLSMPCFVANEDEINIADYGKSNSGMLKHLYRQGLKNRYGSIMQVIAGVHYNFSFPDKLWDVWYPDKVNSERQTAISDSYLAIIRNYYRFGWLIPYFFGSSPSLCSTFITEKTPKYDFKTTPGGALYLENATSLRLSDLGYTNAEQDSIHIGFNSLDEYISGMRLALKIPSMNFAKIEVKKDGQYQQLNTNVLQMENEYYAPIRLKRVAKKDELQLDALEQRGIEYIEVRSLDLDPFSPIGVSEQQVRFLDIFIVWCLLQPSDKMAEKELACWRANWKKVVLAGRDPNLELQIGCSDKKLNLKQWGLDCLTQFKEIAALFDKVHGSNNYQQTCTQLEQMLYNPSLTRSGKMLNSMLEHKFTLKDIAYNAALNYKESVLNMPYKFYDREDFMVEAKQSVARALKLENTEKIDIADYLAQYFAYLE